MTGSNEFSEATLLWSNHLVFEPDPLAEALIALLNRDGTPPLRMAASDDMHLLITGSGLEVIVMLCNVPFPQQHFAGALRADKRESSDTSVLRRLTAHTQSVTVLVRSGEDTLTCTPASDHICRKAADLLSVLLEPELVFIAETDKLYTRAEFEAEIDKETVGAEAPEGADSPFTVSHPKSGATRDLGIDPRHAVMDASAPATGHPYQKGHFTQVANGRRKLEADTANSLPALVASRTGTAYQTLVPISLLGFLLGALLPLMNLYTGEGSFALSRLISAADLPAKAGLLGMI